MSETKKQDAPKVEETKKGAPKAVGFVVAERKAVVGIRRILGAGEPISAEDVHGGQESLARLAAKGIIKGAA